MLSNKEYRGFKAYYEGDGYVAQQAGTNVPTVTPGVPEFTEEQKAQLLKEYQEWDDDDPDKPVDFQTFMQSKVKESANSINNQRTDLSDKERVEARRLGLDEKGLPTTLDDKGLATGPGGIKYDPYKEYIGRDPNTGAPAKFPKGYTDPQTGQAPADYFEEAEQVDEGTAPEGVKQTVAAENKVRGVGEYTGSTVGTKPETKPAAGTKPETKPAAKELYQEALDGKLDTSDPDKTYMLINSIATALHNTGISLGNVAAAYTGGSTSNDYQTSEWEKRMSQRAQARTESDILRDIPNSEEGLRLKAAQISNLNAGEQRALANQIISRFYDKNGHFIGDVNSADFKNLATLANQIRNGGGAKDSLLSQLFARFAGFTGF